ncbi:MAG: hypothetical protein LBD53_03610 [Tannerella sp.]|jgi:hypothetical protein|nr:hypothetical protein [Tannerella sp.]
MYKYVILCLVIVLLMVRCNDIDSYSVNPKHQPHFSTDTLSFDTIFTTVGSVTGFFMIYNSNDEALNISNITLGSGGSSGFRINVDGRSGNDFNDINIWKHDSIYVAVEVTVDPTDENTPFVMYDSVIFITNGVRQAVILEAYGQNAHILRGGVVFEHDTTLTADRPYLVYDSVKIASGATLTVASGVSFYMHKDARWVIYGTLKTYGSHDEPVTFRGDRLDRLNTALSYDNVASQWQGMYFDAESFDNELNYTMIRNGINGLTFDESNIERKKIDIRNSQIRNMGGTLMFAINCYIEAYNTEFSNSVSYLVLLAGGKYRFAHCTLANYMPSAMGGSSGKNFVQALTLADNLVYVLPDGSEQKLNYPLRQAFFDNCIIDGNSRLDSTQEDNIGELGLVTDQSNVYGNDETFNYRFNHCLIKIYAIESERFIKNIFEKSPTYVKSTPKADGNVYDYVYDFRPDSVSSVRGKADRTIAEEFPTDRFGVNRLEASEGASIGAYEYEAD